MSQVDADLYEFLKTRETGLYKKDNEVRAYVHVYFFDLEDFTKMIREDYFCEGGEDVTLFKDTIAIDLNEIFEYFGNDIIDYKNCFNIDDLKYYGLLESEVKGNE